MMKWTFAFTPKARKQLQQLAPKAQSRIKHAVYEKLVKNPQIYLIPLSGPMGGLYKFRVGEYRLLCHKDDRQLSILVVRVGHRRAVYRDMSTTTGEKGEKKLEFSY